MYRLWRARAGSGSGMFGMANLLLYRKYLRRKYVFRFSGIGYPKMVTEARHEKLETFQAG